MNPSTPEILATIFFGLAVLHTFLISQFERMASKYPEGSIPENFFHLMGEVEVVFGLWAGLFIATYGLFLGPKIAFSYVESLNFNEPLFVFAIMTVAASRPIITLARSLIFWVARLLPITPEIGTYVSCLVVGPLLGSLITEPAAMTVTAFILRERYFQSTTSERLKYLTLATLFVNISIGGVLTPYAAPPVLMVAEKWNLDLGATMSTFGWKAALATLLNSILAAWVLRRELPQIKIKTTRTQLLLEPTWLKLLHTAFLVSIVLTAHYPSLFIGLFLLFIGVVTITREFQDELRLKESLLVTLFLGGLIVLGEMQNWWLKPLLQNLDAFPLFLGTTALTAVTDNAALTFLGSHIEGTSSTFRYALLTGAVSGGGLSVIANAPNPAGFAILQDSFGEDRIAPLKLLKSALLPTLIAMSSFWFLSGI